MVCFVQGLKARAIYAHPAHLTLGHAKPTPWIRQEQNNNFRKAQTSGSNALYRAPAGRNLNRMTSRPFRVQQGSPARACGQQSSDESSVEGRFWAGTSEKCGTGNIPLGQGEISIRNEAEGFRPDASRLQLQVEIEFWRDVLREPSGPYFLSL